MEWDPSSDQKYYCGHYQVEVHNDSITTKQKKNMKGVFPIRY